MSHFKGPPQFPAEHNGVTSSVSSPVLARAAISAQDYNFLKGQWYQPNPRDGDLVFGFCDFYMTSTGVFITLNCRSSLYQTVCATDFISNKVNRYAKVSFTSHYNISTVLTMKPECIGYKFERKLKKK